MSLDNIILRLEKLIVILEKKKRESSSSAGNSKSDENASILINKAYNTIDDVIKALEIEKRKN
ncbi:hypothetical protein OA848_05925 [Rickettsiales bacterium]|nr:hypothetical protein [Rickettsiales bacterium]